MSTINIPQITLNNDNHTAPQIDTLTSGERKPLLEDRRRQRKWVDKSQDTEHMRGSRVRNVTRTVTVEPVVILFYTSYTASAPIMQQYFYSRYAVVYNVSSKVLESAINVTSQCAANTSDPAFMAQQEAQAAAARLTVILALCLVIPALVSTILLGAYSDKAGRKKALLPALLGEVVRMAGNALVVYFELPLWILIITFFIDGLVGGAGSVLMACFAYLSDITTPKQRSHRIVLLEVCMGVGVIVSQTVVGHLISSLGFFYPMLIIALLNTVNFIYVLFFLPETINKDPSAKLFTTSHLRKILDLYLVDDWKERCWKLQLCLTIFVIATIVELGTTEIATLYLLNAPLCWTSVLIGYYNSLNYLLRNLGAILCLKLAYRWVGDAGLITIGVLSAIGYELTMSFATKNLTVFMAPVAGLGMQLVMPMARAVSSKLVGTEEQGALFASQGWMQLFGGLVGTMLFNLVYGTTLYLIHGFAFIVAACILVIPLIMAIFLLVVVKKTEQQQSEFAERLTMAEKHTASAPPLS